MKWIKTKDRVPELTVKTNEGLRSKLLIGKYNDDNEFPYEFLYYESFYDDEYDYTAFFTGHHDEASDPYEWAYLDLE